MKNLKKSLNFFKQLTNSTGIIQHTKYGLPDRKKGYSLDDNARALIVALSWYRQSKNKKALELAGVYLAWLIHAKTDEGYFHNFASFDGEFGEDFSEDGFGRAYWALGFTFFANVRDRLTFPAKTIIDEVSHNLDKLSSPRALGYCLLGLYYLSLAEPSNQLWKEKIKTLTDRLVTQFEKVSTKDWVWFEDILAYSNHVLPLALLKSYLILKKAEYKEVGLASLDFVEKQSRIDGVPSPVGSNGWFVKGKERAIYDQQPIEASEAVLAHLAAFEVTKDDGYRQKAQDWAEWYSGNNIRRASLINEETGGCYDGLMETGVNKNQGAESIIAYLMAQLAIQEPS